MHTTNHFDRFIAIAADSKATEGQQPTEHAATARRIFDMIHRHPYRLTSNEVIYAARVAAKGQDAPRRDEFFSKGQACVMGWGIHFDARVEPGEYRRLATTLDVKAAMRGSRTGQ